jgi:hypothetical protein
MDFFGKDFKKTLALPFYLAVTSRTIEGFSDVDQYGENPDIDTGGPEDIWEQ